MGFFEQVGNCLSWQHGQERLWMEPWGADSVRVRVNLTGERLDLPGALDGQPANQGVIEIGAKNASLRVGKLRAELDSAGRVRFWEAESGKLLLEEATISSGLPQARSFRSRAGSVFQIAARFAPQSGERFYGLGQHQHGFLDQKGCVIELRQRNSEVSIPFLISSRGYGFLWHNPAVGRVELGFNGTTWVADAARQLDYWVTAGDSSAELLEHYTAVTGRAPLLPEWAAGFWQCKLRYASQEQLLEVARTYHRRGLPLAVIVVDYFHWTRMGDWKFDPIQWPDPAGMAAELEQMGVKLMVSIWPTANPASQNFKLMAERGWLVETERGVSALSVFADVGEDGPTYLHFYDATNPAARQFLWEQVRKNYYDQGVRAFWLDACEPEARPDDPEHLRYALGSGQEIGGLYPLLHEQGFYEGLRAAGETEIIHLCRSAWAGSQRYGAAVWSGDIPSTFDALRKQVRAGLNIGLSGIPWWTTDIGGFLGGDIHDPSFRELLVRWFQYGAFCPLFRMHGYRLPLVGNDTGTGAENEVWSYGEQAYAILRRFLFLRERLRPYIMEQMGLASQNGTPPMRPLFFDFARDLAAHEVDDQFMFGPDLMVAPVLNEGNRARQVYLPAGAAWEDAWTGEALAGGQRLLANAPLSRIPVYIRSGSRLGDLFKDLPE
jgi:alpha-D-xyloside xylohydrolase